MATAHLPQTPSSPFSQRRIQNGGGKGEKNYVRTLDPVDRTKVITTRSDIPSPVVFLCMCLRVRAVQAHEHRQPPSASHRRVLSPSLALFIRLRAAPPLPEPALVLSLMPALFSACERACLFQQQTEREGVSRVVG